MKKLISLLFIFFAVVSCKKEEPAAKNNCDLRPDSGPCLAFMRRYYYDKTTGQCKEFIWGGCGGVVPFETLEACKICGEH